MGFDNLFILNQTEEDELARSRDSERPLKDLLLNPNDLELSIRGYQLFRDAVENKLKFYSLPQQEDYYKGN